MTSIYNKTTLHYKTKTVCINLFVKSTIISSRKIYLSEFAVMTNDDHLCNSDLEIDAPRPSYPFVCLNQKLSYKKSDTSNVIHNKLI